MSSLMKIVSGGQTGVDRAALDVAMSFEIEHGGYCPAGRRAEDGPIPDVYQLVETDKRDYAVRTEMNVVHSDGTLILYRTKLSGGTELTSKLARKHNRQCLAIDLDFLPGSTDENSEEDSVAAIARVSNWIDSENIGVLNVAGPRESSSPGITLAAEQFLSLVFEQRASR